MLKLRSNFLHGGRSKNMSENIESYKYTVFLAGRDFLLQ